MDKEIKERIAAINSGIIPEGYKKTKVGIVPVEWEMCHFKKMFERLKRKNAENNTNVLTISAQYGLINQEEFFNKSVASEDKSNYFLLYKGDFAYNKSYSNGYPFGAIKALEKYDKGVVSPLYICFSPTDKNKCPEYYLQYFESGNMNREIQAIAQEGARNHGLLNICIDDFFNSYLVVPPLPEQQKIAEILSMQDKLIELQEKKIEQLKELKKAYLQKMFPQKGSKYPELRFKGFTDPWEQRKLGEIYSFQYGEFNNNPDNGGVYPIYGANGIIGGYTEYNAEDSAVIGHMGAYAGYVVWAEGKHFVTYNGTIAKPSDNTTDSKYGFYLLSSKQIYRICAGSGQPFVSYNDLNNIDVVIPKAKEEQRKIGNYFSHLDSLITLHQRKLEQEKQKKKSLMQLLLTGIVRTK